MPTPTVANVLENMNDDWIRSVDIAQILGVTPSAVTNWKKRFGDFPQPLFQLGTNKVYSKTAVLAWAEARQKGFNHGGARVPSLETMLRLAGRMSDVDRARLKTLL